MVTLQSRLSTDDCDKKIDFGKPSWLCCSVAMTAEFVLFIAIIELLSPRRLFATHLLWFCIAETAMQKYDNKFIPVKYSAPAVYTVNFAYNDTRRGIRKVSLFAKLGLPYS